MTNSETVSAERLGRFIETCEAMGDAGDGKRYAWWDDLTSTLRELLALRTQPAQPVNEPGEWQDGFVAEYEVTNAVEAYRHAYPDGSSRAGHQGMRAALEGFAYRRAASIPAEAQGREVNDEDRMQKISEVITHLQSIKERFGDTCVYVRRGGMSWGAVALNRRDDDKKNGVFDLQAQHDRDMTARLEQVQRLIEDNRDLRARLDAALSVKPQNGEDGE